MITAKQFKRAQFLGDDTHQKQARKSDWETLASI